MVSSFHERSIRIVRRIERDVACGLLVGGKRPLRHAGQWVARLFPLARAKAVGAGVVVMHWQLLRAGFLRRAADAGIAVLVWTVDEAPLLRSLLADDRVAGVITNIPDIALIERATP
jgi:glycerophosphoryl diester phosphodiesterase